MITVIHFLPQDKVTAWDGELPQVGDWLDLVIRTSAKSTGPELAGFNNSRAPTEETYVDGCVKSRRWTGPGSMVLTLGSGYEPQ